MKTIFNFLMSGVIRGMAFIVAIALYFITNLYGLILSFFSKEKAVQRINLPKFLKIDVQIRSNRILLVILIVSVLNFIFLAGTTFYNDTVLNAKTPLEGFISRQFNLALENVVATWYSSMLLLSVALVCLLCFGLDRKRSNSVRDRFLSYVWLAFGLIFVLLSFDEIGSLHEIVNSITVVETKEEGTFSSVSALLIMVVFVGMFMLYFFWIKFRRNLWSLLLAAVGGLLFISNPMQEAYEMHLLHSVHNGVWRRPNIFVLIEEGSEIFGTLCFLISFLLYFSFERSLPLNRLFKTPIAYKDSFGIKPALLILVAVMCLGAFSLFVLKWYADWFEVGDAGIPKNWFSSAVCFIGALLSLTFYLDQRQRLVAKTGLYVLSGLFFLIMSAYYGSNIYASESLAEANKLEAAHSFVLIFSLFMAVALLQAIRYKYFYIVVVFWLLLQILSTRYIEYTSQLAYISSSLLVFSITVFYLNNINRLSINS